MHHARELDRAQPSAPDADRVNNLVGAFMALNPQGELLAARASAEMPEFAYTTGDETGRGLLRHFQGIQRLDSGGHVVLTGSDYAGNGGSELYICGVDAHRGTAPLLSNITHAKEPPDTNRVRERILLDTALWHPGGVDSVGNILAVPVEHGDSPWRYGLIVGNVDRPRLEDQSKVYFLDVADPEQPKFFAGDDECIVRRTVKAGAVAITRLPNGFYLCGVWSDSDKSDPPRMDFYLSEDDEFNGRFRPDAVQTWTPDNKDHGQWAGQFQSVSFLHDESGRLYLVGFHEQAKQHWGQLYTVDIPGATKRPQNGAGIEPPIIRRIKQKRFACREGYADMRAAASAYSSGGQLLVYATPQYREGRNGRVQFTEYRPPLAGEGKATEQTEWIELFDEIGLRGKTLTLRDLTTTGHIPDYERLRVHGKHFGDRVRSARYFIRPGVQYSLYEHDSFENRVLTLRGSGRIEQEPDLDAIGKGGLISSSRLEQRP